MSYFKLCVPVMVLTLVLGGCGPSGKEVKKGDIVVTEEVLRETAETQWEDNYTDGFITEIPKGTKLEVLYTPAETAQVFECRPVEVKGEKDPGGSQRRKGSRYGRSILRTGTGQE